LTETEKDRHDHGFVGKGGGKCHQKEKKKNPRPIWSKTKKTENKRAQKLRTRQILQQERGTGGGEKNTVEKT